MDEGLDLWEARATWSVGHAFGLGDVFARIAHNFGLEDITTQHDLPFARHPNSIAVLFTRVTDQSTQHTLWVPLVLFVWGCAKNTQVTNRCILSSSQFLRYLTFHWCRPSKVEYIYHSITDLNPQFFWQSIDVKHRVGALHNHMIFLLCSTILFGSLWHGESVRNTIFF
jgi:hypothetical protein